MRLIIEGIVMRKGQMSYQCFNRHDDDYMNHCYDDDATEAPARTCSVVSSQTFQSTDAVVTIDPDVVDPHTPTKPQPRNSQRPRSRGRCDVSKNDHHPIVNNDNQVRAVSQSRRVLRQPISRSNDNNMDQDDTTHAPSPISTSILCRSNRRNDASNESVKSLQRYDTNGSSVPVVISKPRNIEKDGSGRDYNKKSFVSVSYVQRLNRSLPYLHGEESKKNKMYSLAMPLTPTEGSTRPKIQSPPVSTGRSGIGNRKSSIRNTELWPSSTVEPSLIPKDTYPPHQNHPSSPISRPMVNKLTKLEEHFFDSFRGSGSVQPSSTTGKILDDQSHSYHSPPSQRSPNNMICSIKPRRLNPTSDNGHMEPVKMSSRRTLDVTTTSASTPNKSKKIMRRKVSVDELENVIQFEPSLRQAIVAANHHHHHHPIVRPSKPSNNNDGVVDRLSCSDASPSSPPLLNPSSIKSKGRMIPVVTTKPKHEDLPTSKTVCTKEEIPPVSPNTRISVVRAPKLSSPISKTHFISDPFYQSCPLSFDKHTAAYKNNCASPVAADRHEKTLGVAPVSPSKLQMIPVVHKSPTPRKSKPSDTERVNLSHPRNNTNRSKNTTMKSDTNDPFMNKISTNSVTSRTSHTMTDTRYYHNVRQ